MWPRGPRVGCFSVLLDLFVELWLILKKIQCLQIGPSKGVRIQPPPIRNVLP